ncbi:MAG: tRNA-specific 2-thiouridylase MnmA [Candidatus Falkowbacteria bacterium GW2011_GWC2_38_22]|uniref:tRNA-specific 2-thiouridylase MnmA n=1 Tax=Candidatus Falkowbacteria bacterium GW2011_GWE1_38_31 TaxID=1618638 RepID=A0A0G0M7I8_9BACT|nr:MAG: tRNA-specific 2-thiouridylase MnmA [Candidatus Falkowbacteria bacterium GW2011_GWF2_38_1205]KKQ60667.1 MAG: tRNA-specific 2-thiouridylase MnmA [Candidatus Falkowbacteria bacterium GW2011_GWC2_38_22]KKQ62807.1 MAG: tRNA-specific 2-thiouridylase MnmA [Candidatus Falkowbacteria bacterium GW2011_GWF1_38_22]KKQ64919.1 MAG: tRNA-specific 2-thiouridylase MnmA [Candidatus Falkowbacteria bacterium GW2011_GWE2_38_254]KKQ69639.1 MAG: tRNA-specific 2-thiouridylase MnmA [Candidatus Falkowbacteria ba
MKKILLAMSGGVDSSVAALLLQKQGFSVLGAYMRLKSDYAEGERAARLVAEKLGIKFYPLNISQKFKQDVMDYFVDSYKDGITPNPCVRCNKLIKFGELLRVKEDMGADYLATGHYVQIKKDNKEINLCRAVDRNKDQSYFLYNLTQDQLKQIIFPLGGYTKYEIKKIAEKNNLPNIKTESQDVCFLLDEGKIVEHNEYLKNHIKANPGQIMTLDGKTIGKHQGLYFYTRGQRKGIEIGGTGPYYAASMDYAKNILYVVKDPDDPALFGNEFFINNTNWILNRIKFPVHCEVAIRYRHKAVACVVEPIDSGNYKVILKKPERAITPGQSAVFYAGDTVLGGGEICV